ncbi:MAG: hypothetical protein RIA71_14375 [Oceanicaulis sp.]
MALSKEVKIAERFQRAVRIDEDRDGVGALEGFLCPKSSSEMILGMARQIEHARQCAFTWTGPYGGGKSSLAVAFGALFRRQKTLRDQAEQLFDEAVVNALRDALPSSAEGWRIVTVVGSRADPLQAIGEALIAEVPGLEVPADGWSEKALLQELARVADECGVLLLVDEMGKFLEAASAGEADVHLFQQLAELANRSDARLLFIGILHQAFANYAGRVAREKRDEWSKIQGRFLDLAVNIAGEEQLEIISRAIVAKSEPPRERLVGEAVADHIRETRRHKLTGLGETLDACWPLHPVSAALLGPISRRRFGQNQRSVFGFLNSVEPDGFRDFLAKAEAGELYEAWRLWDYLQQNLEASILASPDGHKWATAAEAIARAGALGSSSDHIRFLKTLALLDLFGERAGLLPSLEILSLSLPATDNADQILRDLEDWSLVVFRRFKGAYAIFAGSDFDIDEALEEASREAGELDVSALKNVAAIQPILAKRHYHAFGAMRWFNIDLCAVRDYADGAWQAPKTKDAIGTFLLLVPTEEDEIELTREVARQPPKSEGDHTLIIGHSGRAWAAVLYAREVLALERVREGHPALSSDPIARREVQSRLVELTARVETELELAFESSLWRVDESEPRRLLGFERNQLASDIADSLFEKSPRLRNELLNRTKPSSNAIAAQNALLKRMVLHEEEDRLAIEGYPAEGGLYASLLDHTGLHRNNGKRLGFFEPAGTDPANLRPLWEHAKKFLAENSDRIVALSEVYDEWAKAPFGVKRGLMPVLAIALILSLRDKVAFYRDGVFQSRFRDVDAEVLARDASDIQIRWMDLTPSAKAVLSGLADTVRELDQKNQLLDLEPIDVARGLVGIFLGLPEWTKRTMRLSKSTLHIRNLFKKAHDPNKLLFDDLPRELGLSATDGDSSPFVAAVREALHELVEAYPAALSRLRTLLLSELDVPSEAPSALEELRARAENVRRVAGDHQLEAFISRLTAFSGSDEDIEGLISLVVSRPPNLWSDADLDKAGFEFADHAQRFNRLEAFARVRGRQDKRHSIAMVIGLDGRPKPFSREFQVSEGERAEIEELQNRLKAALGEPGTHRKDVLLAAIAALASNLLMEKDADQNLEEAG